MIDVVVVGAGPAGAVAATVLARAGARVKIVDRATFPRDKLCGDTVNPGTLAMLRRLGLSAAAESGGLRVDGMIVSGEGGVEISARYPRDLHGRALSRAEFDWALVQNAMAAGAQFDPGVNVRGAHVDGARGRSTVAGIRVGSASGGETSIDAPITIAADGRHSTLAFGLGLARHPARPRRWAIGAYFEAVAPHSNGPSFGEMHIRRGRYLGIAPLPGGRINVCLVKPSVAGDSEFRDPAALLRAAIESDPKLADRFRVARALGQPVLLGPLAVETTGNTIDGLLLAGDAAGFVDPMTGDGLRFAVRGGELAAEAALRALERGWIGVHTALRHAREREFASKRRFNVALRTLVSAPAAVDIAASAARFIPGVVRSIVARAGDCREA